VGAVLSPGSRLASVTAALATAAVLLLAGAASLIPSLLTNADCTSGGDPNVRPSASATETIPARYLALYQQAGAAHRVPWTLLAAIGAIESDHGRSHAPGVLSGVNAFGCCAGPMQFNVRDGPPSTCQAYRVDGDSDGDTDPYDPADAIASAATTCRR
jgi:membrane-bound lytic murein transglycosylase B